VPIRSVDAAVDARPAAPGRPPKAAARRGRGRVWRSRLVQVRLNSATERVARFYDDAGFCQVCDAPYCYHHWHVFEGGYGHCPRGHGKSLDRTGSSALQDRSVTGG